MFRSHNSVTVPMMRIREVGVKVRLRRMSMAVPVRGVGFCLQFVFVLMVRVVNMLMIVFEFDMGVLVRMMLGQMQPGSKGHQDTRDQ